jgi:hypothetical protein
MNDEGEPLHEKRLPGNFDFQLLLGRAAAGRNHRAQELDPRVLGTLQNELRDVDERRHDHGIEAGKQAA